MISQAYGVLVRRPLACRLPSAESVTASGPKRPIGATGRLRQVFTQLAENPRPPRRLAIAPYSPCPLGTGS